MNNLISIASAFALMGSATAQTSSASSAPAVDGAQPQWIAYASSPLTDWTNRVVELRDGTIVSAGFLNRDDAADPADWNMFVEAYDGRGRRKWSQSFGGSGVDAIWAARELEDSSLVFGGIASKASGGDLDAALTILSGARGQPQTFRFGGPGDDRATDVLVLVDGNFLLVGQTSPKDGVAPDLLLVKTDRQGRELWRRSFGGADDDRGFFAIPTADGGAAIAGVTGPRGSYDFLLLRVDREGQEVWRQTVGGDGNDATHGIAALSGGRILLTGYGPSWNGRGNDVSVLIFEADGRLTSHQVIGGSGDDRVQFAAPGPDGAVWLTGYTKSFSSQWRMLLAKVDPKGRIEPWLGAIGGTGDVNGSAVTVAQNGDLLLGGYSRLPSNGKAPPDAFTMRISPASIVRRTEDVRVREVPTSPQRP